MGNAASKVVYTVMVRPLSCAKLFVYYFEGMEKLLKPSEDWRAISEPLQSSNMRPRLYAVLHHSTSEHTKVQRESWSVLALFRLLSYCIRNNKLALTRLLLLNKIGRDSK